METLVFLCNGDEDFFSEAGVIKNSQLSDLMKKKISLGEYYFIKGWSCWNSKSIKVGDRAYLLRSGSNPRGFIAAGNIVAAPEDEQLRHQSDKYSNLSEAYINDYDGCFYICIQIDSVVDFDSPLESDYLKNMPEFRSVNFNFGRGGARFDKKAATTLESKWLEHSSKQQRLGKGRRLVDFFFEKGEEYKSKKQLQDAIDSYQRVLEIDSNDSRSRNRIKTCESILNRNARLLSQEDLNIKGQDELIDKLAKPTSISNLLLIEEQLDKEDFFSSPSRDVAQNRIFVSIARRQGQAKFRQTLLEAYEYKCAISSFDAEASLEAAHILPYIETENSSPSNGLLLRADLHTLFDLNLFYIHPETMQILLCPDLQKTEYRSIHYKQIRIPRDVLLRPNQRFLEERMKLCDWL